MKFEGRRGLQSRRVEEHLLRFEEDWVRGSLPTKKTKDRGMTIATMTRLALVVMVAVMIGMKEGVEGFLGKQGGMMTR